MQLEPENEDVYRKYSNALSKSGRIDSALQFNKNLYLKNPDSYIPYENISYLYFDVGDTLKAINYYHAAFQKGLRNPNIAPIIQELLIRYNQPEKAREIKELMQHY
jgi:tetratricopeptide (TPR) repeat protein